MTERGYSAGRPVAFLPACVPEYEVTGTDWDGEKRQQHDEGHLPQVN